MREGQIAGQTLSDGDRGRSTVRPSGRPPARTQRRPWHRPVRSVPMADPFVPVIVEPPALNVDAATAAEFEEFLGHIASHACQGAEIDYVLPYPKHVFLRWVAEAKGYLLHGSNNVDIEVFEPRDQTDAAQR